MYHFLDSFKIHQLKYFFIILFHLYTLICYREKALPKINKLLNSKNAIWHDKHKTCTQKRVPRMKIFYMKYQYLSRGHHSYLYWRAPSERQCLVEAGRTSGCACTHNKPHSRGPDSRWNRCALGQHTLSTERHLNMISNYRDTEMQGFRFYVKPFWH